MTLLQIPDRDLWRGFRLVYEQVGSAIERELLASTQLSGADHGVLSRLAEADGRSLRQQDLANAMRWDRTRLSHHLTRMEERGLVERLKLDKAGTYVAMTPEGDRLRKKADPVHAEAVTTHFISKLTRQQREALAALAEAMSAGQ